MPFEHIRPYNDSEIQEVLQRLSNNQELISTLVSFRLPSWPSWSKKIAGFFLKLVIKNRVAKIHNIKDFQLQVEKYMRHMIETTTRSLTFSGLTELDLKKPCLFISNHRDIALDPAFVNWALHINGFDTVRIAIGDNLLTKEWVSDVMRLNKSFIVNRSAETKREKLNAAKKLSAYIHHSLTQENAHIWIAQREGRAKDGDDLTNPAIISMLMLNKPKEMVFNEYLSQLRIVPVSISYEYDPCDSAKANELHQQEKDGGYEKGDQEDVLSISKGITGYKGRVHLSFGSPMGLEHEFGSAKEVAVELNKVIHSNYHLSVPNFVAANEVYLDKYKTKNNIDESTHEEEKERFEKRISEIPVELRDKVLAMYARPVSNFYNED